MKRFGWCDVLLMAQLSTRRCRILMLKPLLLLSRGCHGLWLFQGGEVVDGVWRAFFRRLLILFHQRFLVLRHRRSLILHVPCDSNDNNKPLRKDARKLPAAARDLDSLSGHLIDSLPCRLRANKHSLWEGTQNRRLLATGPSPVLRKSPGGCASFTSFMVCSRFHSHHRSALMVSSPGDNPEQMWF
jgi:hypothetical protein